MKPNLCIWSILISGSCLISITTHAAQGAYFDQEPPGLTPKIFAPGIISVDNRHDFSVAFSPDGKECYFTLRHPSLGYFWIYESKYRNDAWATPQLAPYINTNTYPAAMRPSVSPDGTNLFFVSYLHNDTQLGVSQCTRTTNDSWSSPAGMVSQIDSTSSEISCHLSDLGNMFVCSHRPGTGSCDGWYIPTSNGQFQAAEELLIMNTSSEDCAFTPAPNEAYMIFQSTRPGGQGSFDLYISFALLGGGWSAPINLGPTINSPQKDQSPCLSHDGRYLFFSSDRNGDEDIFWVETWAFLKNYQSIDHDGDGLPDWWEIQCSTNATSIEAEIDMDEDGCSNQEEWVADTDPGCPCSSFKLKPDSEPTNLTFTSSSYRQYQVQSSTNHAVSNTTWQTELDWFEGSYSQTIKSVSADASNCFYRVRVKLP